MLTNFNKKLQQTQFVALQPNFTSIKVLSVLPLLTVARPSSPGVRQLSVGEVRVRVRGDRGVLGVRGDGRVSQAL